MVVDPLTTNLLMLGTHDYIRQGCAFPWSKHAGHRLPPL